MPKIFLLFSFAIFTISNTPSEETSSVDMFYYVSRLLLFSIWMNQKKCHLLDIWRKSKFHFGHFMPTFVIMFVILYAFRSSYVCYHGFLLFDLWTGIYTIKSYNNKNMHTKLTESSCKQNRTSLVPWYYFLIKLHDRFFFIWCSTNVRLVRTQFICLWINF